MKTVVFSPYLSIPLFLFYSLGYFAVEPAQAQRKVPLLSTICVKKGTFYEDTKQVSIGREFYDSVFRTNEGSLLTCKIKSDKFSKFKTLNIKFGIADGETTITGSYGPSPTKVNVYLDGKEAATRSITEGQIDNISLELKNTRSVAIEVSCVYQSEGCKLVSFIEASLL
ncbi:hypothetical protein FJR11_20720 [Anabaena sp. UHCC 0187]|uniref:hypothetical protein n=1 Tax=Anabaena sp. UHCC 0187 TaxID=2590018 RepID=UPI0014479900|nr:hypothetical protein [Anabaena sp. UHCC 0187]MTJ14956.1 hypothetical protein [Anabaena sp. UHCC 0187]